MTRPDEPEACHAHGPMTLHFGHLYHCQPCCDAGQRCYLDTPREPKPQEDEP